MIASWACEVTEILTQRSSDPTNPTSNQLPDRDIAVSVVYDTI